MHPRPLVAWEPACGRGSPYDGQAPLPRMTWRGSPHDTQPGATRALLAILI